ncbi:WD40 repeat-like protein [Dendrothele bispora CBS 962.96]|uniref:Pre-rRNA-processing protein IPI3 n=1 Tax=Dendrothele bispora (strain CBS 962.96) TaxID=1314807 RepID=A0A4S8LQ77_DENBC|nr:WD40 repeat-like protein [Dendrothele bispora CBS 962.96]
MRLQESIFCATASSSGSGSGAVSIHDIVTGSSLASFKQTNAGPRCTAYLESKNAQGGFFLAAQPDKSLLHVYNFQKDQISLKIVLPEKLTCVALDPRGNYFAGGTAQGRIHLWEAMNILRFTQDGSALISGSDDSSISVWSVSRLLDEDTQNELPLPYYTLTDHTLPITDIICGVGSFPTCRILTSSVDHSVKLWDLASRSMLTTFMFPKAISCLAWDITERFFFAASSDGSIHQMNLFKQREDKSKAPLTEAIGGGGLNDIIRVDDESTNTHKKRLITVGQPVSCIAISFTSSSLLVGTSSGLIHIYDVPTHQLIRTISTHKGFSITHLSTMLKPIDLIGHVNLRMNVGTMSDARETIPVKPVVPFQRMRDAKTRDLHDLSVLLPTQDESSEEPVWYSKDSFLRDHAYFSQPLSSTERGNDASTLQSRISDLEAEVVQLREQLGQAKGINNAMWETVVQRVVGQGKNLKDKKHFDDNDSDEETGRRHKRGRT